MARKTTRKHRDNSKKVSRVRINSRTLLPPMPSPIAKKKQRG